MSRLKKFKSLIIEAIPDCESEKIIAELRLLLCIVELYKPEELEETFSIISDYITESPDDICREWHKIFRQTDVSRTNPNYDRMMWLVIDISQTVRDIFKQLIIDERSK